MSKSLLTRSWATTLSSALALLFVALAISLCFGAVPVSIFDVVTLWDESSSSSTKIIITELRLPRTLSAALVGATLAICGTATQGLFRNPLADPSLIGVSAGAGMGASIAIVLLGFVQHSTSFISLVSVAAFLGALVVVYLVYSVSTNAFGTSVTTMLLAGIALTFLAGAVSGWLELIADNNMLRRISLWRMGSFEGANYFQLSIQALGLFAIVVLLLRQSQALNALLLGESEARHLGFDIHRLKQLIVACVAAGTAISVAMAGTIAFVGLVVPHMVRFLVGPNHRYLLPLSAIGGALLLIVADTAARSLMAPTELPVGLITVVVGAPIFISMLRRPHTLAAA